MGNEEQNKSLFDNLDMHHTRMVQLWLVMINT